MSGALDPAAEARLAALLAAPRGRRVGVLGLGVSGRAMALHLGRRGAHVVAVDSRAETDGAAFARAFAAAAPGAGLSVRLGAPDADTFADVEALAISPGADPRQAAVQAVLASGRPVVGELGLCGALPAPAIAITGTNGKSTTTALVGALVQGLGHQAFVGGNLGEPVVAWLDSGVPADWAVLELSSYQLEAAHGFAPQVGVVLNVAPDHLERYGGVAEYAAVKARLVACVPPTGRVVLNADDPAVRAMAARAQAPVWWFTAGAAALPGTGDGVRLEGDDLVGCGALAAFGRLPLAHPRLLGAHNRANGLAALLAVHAAGLAPRAAALEPGYLAFAGLPHRLELVAEVDGVSYIDDSKATNDAAAAIGLQAMQRPTWLLAGGRDKGGGYAALVAAARALGAPGGGRGLRGAFVFGAAAPLLEAAFAAAGLPVRRLPALADACAAARAAAAPGDVVLLSPACSSFDAFVDYRARGAAFAAWARAQAASRRQP